MSKQEKCPHCSSFLVSDQIPLTEDGNCKGCLGHVGVQTHAPMCFYRLDDIPFAALPPPPAPDWANPSIPKAINQSVKKKIIAGIVRGLLLIAGTIWVLYMLGAYD